MHNVSSICAPEILLALAKPGSRGQGELLWRKLELRQPPPLPVRKLRGEQPVVSTPQPRTQILA